MRHTNGPRVQLARPTYPNAGWYLRNCREAFRITDGGGRFRMGHHGSHGEYGPEHGDPYVKSWRQEFLDALNRRINVKGALPVATATWRRLESYWYWGAWRLARKVNTPRLRVYITETPLEFRARLAHRLTDPREN